MDHKIPLISAIIPVYNRPEQIKESAMSVLRQSWRPLELIIGDDGSDDQTPLVLQHLLKEQSGGDISLKILPLDHTGMPGAVRNRCVEAAEGEYLAFLDSDDLWLPEKLEKQYALFEKDPHLVITHTREEWNRSGRIISQAGMRHLREGDLFSDSLKKCIIGPSTVMIQTDYYRSTGGFRKDLEIAEDYEFWLRITAEQQIGYLDEALTVKRAGHEGQLSEKYGHIEVFRIQGLKSLVDSEYFEGWQAQAASRELGRKCRVYGRGCLKRKKPEEGQAYLDLAGYYDVLADNIVVESI